MNFVVGASRLLAVAAALAPLAAPTAAHGRSIHLYPGSSFISAAEALVAGDTLIVHAGTYSETSRSSLANIGTASSPILITGAPGEAAPLITRPLDSTPQNTINIEGAAFLTLRGLEISGNGDGINLNANPHDITIEDCDIHDVDVGINFKSNMQRITVRRNHIHHTGYDGGTGEAMYVGCNYAACAVSESVIEGNWIHDTQVSTQGDGIEIKSGSHSNIIRDNVIYNTGFPCIIVYGTSGNPRNVVEGNVMWNCGDSGIQAAADAVIRNNIILESPGDGFNSQSHQGVTPNNLEFVHNTVVGGSPCIRLSGWGGKQGMVFANNAVYCPSGSYAIGDVTGVSIAGNVMLPGTSSFPTAGYITGNSIAADFMDAAARDVYPAPGSRLIDMGAPGFVTGDDFNGTPRTAPPDAGAYTHTTASNPGWTIVPGFKQQTGSGDSDPPEAILDLLVR